MSRVPAIERSIWGPLLWVAILLFVGLLHACGTEPTRTVQTAGDSYFPLSVGNKWYLSLDLPGDQHDVIDTVQIDSISGFGGDAYYHLRSSWPGFQHGLWIRRDPSGNTTWSAGGRSPEHLFLLFDVPEGTVWPVALAECADSMLMTESYAVVETPCGRFDGVRVIRSVGQCMDFGWEVKMARGVGPVAVIRITIGGLLQYQLTDAVVKDDASSGHLTDPK